MYQNKLSVYSRPLYTLYIRLYGPLHFAFVCFEMCRVSNLLLSRAIYRLRQRNNNHLYVYILFWGGGLSTPVEILWKIVVVGRVTLGRTVTVARQTCLYIYIYIYIYI